MHFRYWCTNRPLAAGLPRCLPGCILRTQHNIYIYDVLTQEIHTKYELFIMYLNIWEKMKFVFSRLFYLVLPIVKLFSSSLVSLGHALKEMMPISLSYVE